MGPKPRPLTDRFFEKINKRGPKQPHMTTRCWVWTAATNGAGYGLIAITRTKSHLAHRVAWELSRHQTIPRGKVVKHECDNPLCVRPSHLKMGSQQDNLCDMSARRRAYHKKLTPEQVQEIRSRYAAGGIGHRPLAEEYKVSRAMIRSILAGTSWKWL